MKKIIFAVLALWVSVGLANLAVAEVYSVRDSSDGGYEVGIEYFKLLKKIEKLPSDINPKLTSAEVLKVFELSQKGEKYLHKGENFGKTTLLSIIPYEAEISAEEYELSITDEGKWNYKLLQSKKPASPAQRNIFYAPMILIFLGILWISLQDRLWSRSTKRLIFFYCMTLLACYLAFHNLTDFEYIRVISLIGIVISVLMLGNSAVTISENFSLFLAGWISYCSGGIMIVIFCLISQKPDPYLLMKQLLIFLFASMVTAFLIGEAVYRLKARFASQKAEGKLMP